MRLGNLILPKKLHPISSKNNLNPNWTSALTLNAHQMAPIWYYFSPFKLFYYFSIPIYQKSESINVEEQLTYVKYYEYKRKLSKRKLCFMNCKHEPKQNQKNEELLTLIWWSRAPTNFLLFLKRIKWKI